MEKRAIELVRGFHAAGKPVAAISHGPWLLVEADIIKGKTVTSWPSIRTDLKNAGGNVVDREVVVDGNVITSRKPDDVEAFTNALIQMLEKARPVAARARGSAEHPRTDGRSEERRAGKERDRKGKSRGSSDHS